MQVFKAQYYLSCIEPGVTFAAIMKENVSRSQYQQMYFNTVM